MKRSNSLRIFRRAAFFYGALSFLAAAEKPNVLLILVDDLKPALGCYGDALAKTPHIDALARRGTRFDLAYCNQAVCAPSRFTLMLGAHSTSTGLYGLGSHLRKILPDAVTMPQHFASHGYRTESLGKVFHIGHGNFGDPQSFSAPHFKEKVIEYVDPASKPGGKLTREEAMFQNVPAPPGGMNRLPRGAAWESPEVADDAYADGRVAAETNRRLEAAKRRLAEDGVPFFIAAGFARPHLPFCAPKKYWDLYDPSRFKLASNPDLPAGAPRVAGKRGGEIRNYFPVPDKDDPARITDRVARKLIHGYYASASFADAQIGKVLQKLDALGLADSTLVVLWGDHGFHLGDLGIWTKHTNYEQANRIPLIFAGPGIQPGGSTGQLAGSVDVFPTLAELAGLPALRGPRKIDGVSLVPVLKDPSARVRDHVFHAYPKAKMGRAIRTARYRLVEWKKPGAPAESAELELYDYQADPLETRNLAADRPEIVSRLRKILANYPEAVPRPQRKRPGTRQSPPPIKRDKRQLASAADPAPRPNILLVFIDDMGWADFSCFGNTEAKTTHIDRLAAEGLRFKQFYVNSPICSPSRVAISTGQYPQRWRITSYLSNRKHNRERGVAQWLDPKAPMLARILKRAGYATGHFGKWHMGGQRDVTDAPPIADYGFDESLTNFEGMGAKLLPLTEVPAKDGGVKRGRIWEKAEILGEPVIWTLRSKITGGFAARAVAFIDKARGRNKPFYINLWPDDVHTPLYPSVQRWSEDGRKRYLAVLEEMDAQLGVLFDRIRNDPKLRDNTIILVCSDNGPEQNFGSAGRLRGIKATLFEGGVRSPLVVWAPKLIPAAKAGGENADAVFAAIDLVPSLLKLAGVEAPAGVAFDGEDLSGTLVGKSEAGRTAPIFFRRPPDRAHFRTFRNLPDLAMREGKWKLLCDYDGGEPQLYDLDNDPGETSNLAGSHQEAVKRLTGEAVAWNRSMPADNGPALGKKPR